MSRDKSWMTVRCPTCKVIGRGCISIRRGKEGMPTALHSSRKKLVNEMLKGAEAEDSK